MSNLAGLTFRHARQACTTIPRYTPFSLAYMARTYNTTASGKDSVHMWLPVGRDAIILQRAREALENLCNITPTPTRSTESKFDGSTMNTDYNATERFKETDTFFFTSEHISSNSTLATLRSELPHCVLISFCGSDPAINEGLSSLSGSGSAGQPGFDSPIYTQSGETINHTNHSQTTHVLIAGHDEIRRAAKILLRREYTIAERAVFDETNPLSSDRRILVPVPKVNVAEDQLPTALIQPWKPLGLADLEDMWTGGEPTNEPRTPKGETAESAELEKQPIYMTADEVLDIAMWSLRSHSSRLMQLMK